MKYLKMVFFCSIAIGSVAVSSQQGESGWVRRMFERQKGQSHGKTLKDRSEQYKGNVSPREKNCLAVQREKEAAERMFDEMGKLSGWTSAGVKAYAETSLGNAAIQNGACLDSIESKFRAELQKRIVE